MVQIRSRVSSSYFPPQVGHSIPGRGFRPSVLDVEQGIGTMASGWQTRQPNLEETTTMYRPTVAEIDLTAIRDNLRAIRACIPLKAQVIGIVKADAYGHGAARVAAVLEPVSYTHLRAHETRHDLVCRLLLEKKKKKKKNKNHQKQQYV